jgi:transposase-like protein
MNLAEIFCPNMDCPARGQTGRGNVSVHSEKEKRCYCNVCKETFSVSKGTIFYRLKTDPDKVMLVITLLAYGCPLQAIVMAFGFDERTVKEWWQRAGVHCHQVHAHIVGQSQLDLQQVQADEIKVKLQGKTVWMALAMMVSTRLWLGGVISVQPDKGLIQALVTQVRQVTLCWPLLVAVDGLSSYVSAFHQAFRTKLPRYGQLGRAKLRAWEEVAIVQVVKQRLKGRLTLDRRIVQGSQTMVAQLIQLSQGAGGINTAFIERLNATFRQRLARHPETLQAGRYVVGGLYNFCTYHDKWCS